jgi:hypothetical protein
MLPTFPDISSTWCPTIVTPLIATPTIPSYSCPKDFGWPGEPGVFGSTNLYARLMGVYFPTLALPFFEPQPQPPDTPHVSQPADVSQPAEQHVGPVEPAEQHVGSPHGAPHDATQSPHAPLASHAPHDAAQPPHAPHALHAPQPCASVLVYSGKEGSSPLYPDAKSQADRTAGHTMESA